MHTFDPSHSSFFFGMMLKVGQLSCDPTVTRRKTDNWKYRRSLAAGGAGLLFPDFLLWKEKKSLFDSAIAGVFLLLPGERSASEQEGGLRARRHKAMASCKMLTSLELKNVSVPCLREPLFPLLLQQ